MTQEQILDEILPGLADEFEAGNQKGRWFTPSNSAEFEPLRECFAMLVAEDLARSFVTPQPMYIVKLTPEGYRKFKPRIDALRSLPR
jgi:hypothetical protein